MKLTRYKKISLFTALLACVMIFSSCQVGPPPSPAIQELNPELTYTVVYDALQGRINTLQVQTAYYAENSLLKMPSGASGMLIQPVNGMKIVEGWYTEYTNEGSEDNPDYVFDKDHRWDFKEDRLSEATAGADKVLTLYARWVESPTIVFVDADDHDSVLAKWEKVDPSKPMVRPTASEITYLNKDVSGVSTTFTLLDYYTDADLTKKAAWDPDKTIADLIEEQEGDPLIRIYCKYIEGDYKRIRSMTDLKNIAKDMEGQYILANDLDFADENWTAIGDDETPFKGKLIGNGYALRNLTVNAENRVSRIEQLTAKEKYYGVFAGLSGATIDGLVFEDSTLTISERSNVGMHVGLFAGKATGTTFKDCKVEGLKIVSGGEVKVKVRLGVAVSNPNGNTFDNCDFPELDLTGLTIAEENLIIGA